MEFLSEIMILREEIEECSDLNELINKKDGLN